METYVKTIETFNMRYALTSVNKDSRLLECHTTSTYKQLPTFWRRLLHPSAESE